MRACLILCIMAVACADSHSSQKVQFSDLAFELPDTWTETNGGGSDYRMWVPTDNARHESIVVIRSNMPPGVSIDSLGQLLEDAQEGLGKSRPQATTTITGSGLHGARVEFDYVPPGSRDTYHRVHTVFVDRDSFVHVLYTAKSAEPELSTVGGLLRTLHQT